MRADRGLSRNHTKRIILTLFQGRDRQVQEKVTLETTKDQLSSKNSNKDELSSYDRYNFLASGGK